MSDILICVTFEGTHLSNRVKIFNNLTEATAYAWNRLTAKQQDETKHCFSAIVECQRVVEDRWTAVVFKNSTFRVVFSMHVLNSTEMYKDKKGGKVFNN
jgi:hypothetical protein